MVLNNQGESPVRIATASVAGEWLEPNMTEHMGLQAVSAAGGMVASGPSALENGGARLFPTNGQSVVGIIAGTHLTISKLLDIAGGNRQLGPLVEDHAAKYGAPLEGRG